MKKRKQKRADINASKSVANRHAVSTLGRARVFKNKKKEKPPKKIKNIQDYIY